MQTGTQRAPCHFTGFMPGKLTQAKHRGCCRMQAACFKQPCHAACATAMAVETVGRTAHRDFVQLALHMVHFTLLRDENVLILANSSRSSKLEDCLQASYFGCSTGRHSAKMIVQGVLKRARWDSQLDSGSYAAPSSAAQAEASGTNAGLPAQGLMSASIDDSTRRMLRMGAQGVQRCCGPRNRSFPQLPLH
jgi:hypothetical protein